MEKNINKPFMSIKETCIFTGLSQAYLRKGVKDGSVPYIMAGAKYLINVPQLMKRLDRESEAADGKMA